MLGLRGYVWTVLWGVEGVLVGHARVERVLFRLRPVKLFKSLFSAFFSAFFQPPKRATVEDQRVEHGSSDPLPRHMCTNAGFDFVHNMVVVVLPACFRGHMLDYALNFKAYIRCC